MSTVLSELDVRWILAVVCEELMSMACYRIRVVVKVPAFHEWETRVNERIRRTRGVGFHSGSEKWWGFIIWLG